MEDIYSLYNRRIKGKNGIKNFVNNKLRKNIKIAKNDKSLKNFYYNFLSETLVSDLRHESLELKNLNRQSELEAVRELVSTKKKMFLYSINDISDPYIVPIIMKYAFELKPSSRSNIYIKRIDGEIKINEVTREFIENLLKDNYHD